MNPHDPTLIPTDIVGDYERSIASCPALMAQRIPAASDDTIQALRQALALARDSREWQIVARYSAVLGLIYFERLNLHDARLNMQESVTMLRLLDDKQKVAQMLGNLAVVEYYLGNSDNALVSARESAQLASELNEHTFKGYFVTTVAAILAYQGLYADADAAFNEAQAAFAHTEDDLAIAWWQFTHSRELARDRSECSAAIQELEAALPVLREHTAPQIVIESLLTLADCYLSTKNLGRAETFLKEAEVLVAQNKRFWSRPELFLLKSRFAIAEGNTAQALKFAYSGLGSVGDQGDYRILAPLYRTLANLLEQDRSRGDDTQDALDRAIAIGRKRSRRLELARALQQAGLHLKHFGNRPTIRARSAGFMYEAERMLTEMGMLPPKVPLASTPTTTPR